MPKERERNQDSRGGDVLVNDSIASGRPDLPIDEDPGRESQIGIDADELGQAAAEGDNHRRGQQQPQRDRR